MPEITQSLLLAAVGLLSWLYWQRRRVVAVRQLQIRLQELQEQQLGWQQTMELQFHEARQQHQQQHSDTLEALRSQRQELTQSVHEDSRQLAGELHNVQQNLENQLHQATRQWHKNHQHHLAGQNAFRQEMTQQLQQMLAATDQRLQEVRQELHQSLHATTEGNDKRLLAMQQQQRDSLQGIARQFTELRDQSLAQLASFQQAQQKQLDTILHTVDEKLQGTLEKRLGESFRQVSQQLEMVHQGLGEMQQLATGVGDLKRVLSNVKTRGILGEYQLGNLLEQMLSPEQYAANVKTRRGSQNVVEYAVRLPGRDERHEVWLPIDSKFPLESYQCLLDARDQGDSAAISRADQELRRRITSFARDIHDKYLDPPNTTDFAIMFLPIEGLYAEALQDPGIFEIIQRKYRITITGPTTLAALLNSLHMGFRTLAVQQRSSEVWRVLADVREEFGRFSGQLEKVCKQLDTAQKSLGILRNTRTNVMQRKLEKVQQVNADQLSELIDHTGDHDD